MAVDDFNRADGAIGSAYERCDGTADFVISSNHLEANSNFDTVIMRVLGTFPDTQEAALDMTFTTGANAAQWGVAVRAASDGSCYHAYLDTNVVTLRHRNAAGTNTFINSAAVTATAGTTYNLRIRAEGTTIKVFFDLASGGTPATTQVLSETDATYSTGNPGIYWNGNTDRPDADIFTYTDASGQFAAPDSDVSNAGSWTTSPLFEKVDETPLSDSDFISSPSAPSNAACVLGIANVTDPAVNTGHKLRIRYRKAAAGSHRMDLAYRLLQGATEIAAWSAADIATAFATTEQTLTGTQADAITDYSDLRVELSANKVASNPAAPTFVAAGTGAATATSGAAMAPALPTGWAANDIHFLVAHHSSNTDFTDPSGWTRISSLVGNNTTAQRVVCWWRRAVAGDTAPSISTASASTAVRVSRIFGIRGCPTTGDPWDVLSFRANAASATISTNSINTTEVNTLVMFVGLYEDDPTAATDPSGYSTDLRFGSTAGNDAAIFEWHKTLSATGAENPSSTISGGTFTNSVNVGIMIAFKGAPLIDTAADVSFIQFEAPEATGGGTQTITLIGMGARDFDGVSALLLNLATTGYAGEEHGGVHNAGLLSVINQHGLLSVEAYGSALIQPGAVSVSLAGARSGEAAGAAQLTTLTTLTLAGRATEEAIGSASLAAIVGLSLLGLASAEATGAHSIQPGAAILNLAGLGPAEVSGNHLLTTLTAITFAGFTSAEFLGPAAVTTLTALSLAGRGSEERSGNATIQAGAVTLTLSGTFPGEWSGNHSAQTGAVSLTLSGSPTTETPGATTLQTGAVTVTFSGQISEERSGNASIQAGAINLSLSGRSSDEAAGATLVTTLTALSLLGLATQEAHGNALLSTLSMLTLAGRGSEEAAGAANLQAGGITLSMAGRGTEEWPGAASIQVGAVTLTLTGRSSEEAAGATLLSRLLSLTGRGSDEAAGNTALTATYTLSLAGALSAEASGAQSLQPGAVSLSMAGAQPGEYAGTSTITTGGIALSLIGTQAGEVAGNTLLTPGAAVLTITGRASDERAGVTTLLGLAFIATIGKATEDAAGNAALTSLATVSAAGAPSTETPGPAAISPGAVTLLTSGRGTEEAAGQTILTAGALLSLAGLGSAEWAAQAIIAPGAVGLSLSGMPTSEAYGDTRALIGVLLSLAGLASAERSGSQILTPGPASLSLTGSPSAEANGVASALSIASITLSGQRSDERAGSAILTAISTLSLAGQRQEEQSGNLIVIPGATGLSLTGLATEERPGALSIGQRLDMSGLSAADLYGRSTIAPGAAILAPIGLGAVDAFGRPAFTLNLQTLGLESGERLGAHSLASVYLIQVAGLSALDLIGVPSITTGAATINFFGLQSGEWAGTIYFSGGRIGAHLVIGDKLRTVLSVSDRDVTVLRIGVKPVTVLRIGDMLQEGQD